MTTVMGAEPASPHHLQALLHRIEERAQHLTVLSRQEHPRLRPPVEGVPGQDEEEDMMVPAFHELVLSCQQLLHQAVFFLKMDSAQALDTDTIRTVKSASRAVSDYLKEIGATVQQGRRQSEAYQKRPPEPQTEEAMTSPATPWIESSAASIAQQIAEQMQTISMRCSVLCRILLTLDQRRMNELGVSIHGLPKPQAPPRKLSRAEDHLISSPASSPLPHHDIAPNGTDREEEEGAARRLLSSEGLMGPEERDEHGEPRLVRIESYFDSASMPAAYAQMSASDPTLPPLGPSGDLHRLAEIHMKALDEVQATKSRLAQYDENLVGPLLNDLDALEQMYIQSIDNLGPARDAYGHMEVAIADQEQLLQNLRSLLATRDVELATLRERCDQSEKERAFAQRMMETLFQENADMKKEWQQQRASKSGALATESTGELAVDASQQARRGSSQLSNKKLPPHLSTSLTAVQLQAGRFSMAQTPSSALYSASGRKQSLKSMGSQDSNLDYDSVFAVSSPTTAQQDQSLIELELLIMQCHLTLENRRRLAPNGKLLKDLAGQFPIAPRKRQRYADNAKEEVKRRWAASLLQRAWRTRKAVKAYKHIRKPIQGVVGLRYEVAAELMATEASYIKGLIIMYRDYYLELCKSIGQPDPPISEDDLRMLFYQIADLIKVNQTILEPLAERVAKWNVDTTIGDVFVDTANHLAMYTDYVNNYQKALTVYHENAKNPVFKAFLARIKTAETQRKQPDLLDLLITPIQRIPRYPLQLKEMLKYTPSTHEDYALTQQAIKVTDDIAKRINDRKSESEKYQAVEELQAKTIAARKRILVYANLITEINEMGRRKTRKMYVLSDMLLCVSPRGGGVFSDKSTTHYDFKWAVKLSEIHTSLFTGSNNDAEVSKDEAMNIFAISMETTTALISAPADAQHAKAYGRKILVCSSSQNRDQWVSIIADSKRKCMVAERNQHVSSSTSHTSTDAAGIPFGRHMIKQTRSHSSAPRHHDGMDHASAQRHLQIQLTITERYLKEETKVLSGLDRLAEVYMDGPEKSSRDKHQQRDKLVSQRTATMARMQYYQTEYDRLLNISHELRDLCAHATSQLSYQIDRANMLRNASAIDFDHQETGKDLGRILVIETRRKN